MSAALEPLFVHVLYEREAYGMGMVLDSQGQLQGFLPARSVNSLRRKLDHTASFRLLDPRAKVRFEETWEIQAVNNFNRYFSRVFGEGSPLVDSDTLFATQISNLPGLSACERVLDLGAGRGHYAQRFGRTAVSLDLSMDASRSSTCDAPSRIVGDAHNLPFAAASFSLVLCLFVLEHVSSPFIVVREICRVLRPGGRLVIAIPSSSPLDILKDMFSRASVTLPINHLRSFGLVPYKFIESIPRLMSWLESGGCKDVDILCATSQNAELPSSRIFSSRKLPFLKYLGGPQTIITATRN